MPTQIFVNLPVRDLPRTKDFFASLGYQYDERFTDDNAACLVVDAGIYVMLLTEPMFAGFAPKPVADGSTTEVLVGLSCDSRAAVDEIVAKAVRAGATTPRTPNDYGFMYQHGFEDLDGHYWEYFHMDPDAIPSDLAEAGSAAPRAE
jgi:predicted lactoylglutathione lyase